MIGWINRTNGWYQEIWIYHKPALALPSPLSSFPTVLTLQIDRFWDAWCQDWTTIQLDRVKDMEISDLPQLAPQQLQSN
ncbi:MAG: hypothetical protein HC778_06010 [Chamaesiphon sp. CSU_1_12]|nr:hypothetical protein [Chamaesiphon sp. CSU_1_12]